jgi:hypothetical protein
MFTVPEVKRQTPHWNKENITMRHWLVLPVIALAAAFALGAGPASKTKYHDTDLPDPKAYNAHFGDMDGSHEGKVNWEEFKAYFPKADPKVFAAIDLDKSGDIDHDEWHKFKEAHGLKHKD